MAPPPYSPRGASPETFTLDYVHVFTVMNTKFELIGQLYIEEECKYNHLQVYIPYAMAPPWGLNP